jgi:hypothetical protein
VIGADRTVTDHPLKVSPSAVQWADGSIDDGRIEAPHVYVFELGESNPLNSTRRESWPQRCWKPLLRSTGGWRRNRNRTNQSKAPATADTAPGNGRTKRRRFDNAKDYPDHRRHRGPLLRAGI